MRNYKVCITAAGLGSRISSISNINKALLPINQGSIISKIIDKFPKNVEFVIAVGYQKEKIVNFLNIAHKNRKIKIVEVKNYQGKGSGPGFTMLQCEKYLKSPFIFIACDTLVEGKIPPPNKNWIGISTISDPEPYLVIEKDKSDKVTRFFDKKSSNFLYWNGYKNYDCNCFIGLAGVYNTKIFWNSLKKNKELNSGEYQVSNGLEGLKNKNLKCIEFKWFDTGNEFNYVKALNFYGNNKVLPKPDEYFYLQKNIVIKYFQDKSKAIERIKKSKFLKNYIPKMIKSDGNFLAYHYEKGDLLSEIKDKKVFLSFLNFVNKNFWLKSNKSQKKIVDNACKNFYKEKTYSRLSMYFKRASFQDRSQIINKIKVPKISDILQKIKWDNIFDSYPILFHGDLQPENIIYNFKKKFILLDWRENFGASKIYGDIYYDFAKLHHALEITGKVIRANKYDVKINEKEVEYYFDIGPHLIRNLKIFENFICDNGFDVTKVRILSALVLLNIAPLHHYPYSELLFHHGKLKLFQVLNNNDTFVKNRI